MALGLPGINAGLSVITLFRMVMYTVNLEFNTKTKFPPAAWQDPKIKEVAYEWTRALRLLFAARLMATFAVCSGGDPTTNWLFLLGTVLFNFLFVLHLFGYTKRANELGDGIDGKGVVRPEHTNVPKILTWIDFLAPLTCALYFSVGGSVAPA
eukprot:TRINITY_DN12582_c0_g1_i4.p2 TRINITY_DN12582_c0_g1~~TRINITY_DN12582_c0_g1_i4.p2  ORF type:complete len:153 (+),score=25.79 TRINITY_DN12582_c0_g1_i4:259-717(+)